MRILGFLLLLLSLPAWAQKPGGTMIVTHIDNPPSASIHEESTSSVIIPFMSLFNNLVINPSVDSIQEFKIQKSMYAAEFGGKASALINVATKAGSNAFSGSLFEFLRNDAFDSANYFQPKGQPIPPLSQNQFGGSLGGPLVTNRSFFFSSVEATRMTRSLTRTFSVPTADVRAGNFAGFGTICDPLTIPTTGVCTPFANNQIPAGRIDPEKIDRTEIEMVLKQRGVQLKPQE